MSNLAGDQSNLLSNYITPLQFFIYVYMIFTFTMLHCTHTPTHTLIYIYTHYQRAAFIYKLKRNETKTKIMLNNLFLPAPLLFVKQLQQRLQQERLEETFAQQLDEMETLYGGALIVSMPTDTLQRDQFTGSTRSSLSSYSEG